MNPLTFYIIYTTGTFKLLSPLALSLLNYSNFNFVIVANGCKMTELKEMQQFCAKDIRLSLVWLPSSETVRHGEVLDFLHKRNSHEYFCFMDSDIFASGDFSKECISMLSKTEALFSGDPIWIKPEEQVLSSKEVHIRGWYNQTSKGQCLGTSYFAIYKNETLEVVMETTGISFKRYVWADVPKKYQVLLEELGLKKKVYDTGKLLNIMFWIYEHRLINYKSDFLIHLGGISNRFHRSSSNRVSLNMLKKNLFLELPFVKAQQIDNLLQRRESIVYYFDSLVLALLNKDVVPGLPEKIIDRTLVEKLKIHTDEIIKLYMHVSNNKKAQIRSITKE